MADDWREAGATAPAEHLTRREPSDAAEQLHMPCAEDECEEVSPSDVLVHGQGSIEEVLEVLCDVRSVQQAQGRRAIARKFDSPNEFEELVKRVRDARATVVLRKGEEREGGEGGDKERRERREREQREERE
jgi:hypothetical protein